MLLASLLLCAGAVSAVPHGNFFNHYRQNPVHNKPLSYAYMQDPMAVMYLQPDRQPGPIRRTASQEYMLGEQFFKHESDYQQRDENSGSDDDTESLPYNLIQDFGPYEEREYPSVKFACVKSEVDNAEDPFAGLKNIDPFTLMGSKRWKKTASSIMFKELFKYISGVNKEGVEVEMTRPVSTHHAIKVEQYGGDQEVQEMCFYIPSKHQDSPPEPLSTSPVYIHKRPAMRVYVRRFSGWALTAEPWLEQRELLESDLIGKPTHAKEYFTNGYDSPFVMKNRRNEVWIQKFEVDLPEKEEVAVAAKDVATEDVAAEDAVAEDAVAEDVASEDVAVLDD